MKQLQRGSSAQTRSRRQILTPRLCFGVYGFSVGQVGRTTTSRAPVATGL
jgi:hypothetical protein